jgi:hypothetical protein
MVATRFSVRAQSLRGDADGCPIYLGFRSANNLVALCLLGPRRYRLYLPGRQQPTEIAEGPEIFRQAVEN